MFIKIMPTKIMKFQTFRYIIERKMIFNFFFILIIFRIQYHLHHQIILLIKFMIVVL